MRRPCRLAAPASSGRPPRWMPPGLLALDRPACSYLPGRSGRGARRVEPREGFDGYVARGLQPPLDHLVGDGLLGCPSSEPSFLVPSFRASSSGRKVVGVELVGEQPSQPSGPQAERQVVRHPGGAEVVFRRPCLARAQRDAVSRRSPSAQRGIPVIGHGLAHHRRGEDRRTAVLDDHAELPPRPAVGIEVDDDELGAGHAVEDGLPPGVVAKVHTGGPGRDEPIAPGLPMATKGPRCRR